MEIAGILFDLYGTLFTYGNMSKAFSIWHQDLSHALRGIGVSTTATQVARLCKHFFSEQVPKESRYTEYEARLKHLVERYGVRPDENWIRRTASTSMNRWQGFVPIHPEAKFLLQSLKKKGIKVGIISNFQHAPHVRKVLQRNGILKILDAVVISGEVHVKNPEPRIFEIALEKLGTKPEETLFVGDDPECDIRGAAAVGIRTRLFQNGASLLKTLEKDIR